MASQGLLIPPAYVPYVFNAAAAVAIVPITAGITGLINPDFGFDMIHFQRPVGAADRRTAEGLLQMYALRQVSLGVGSLVMWYTGSQRALGICMLAGIAVGTIDGMISKQVTGEHVVGHYMAVPLGLFFGGVLVGWL